MVYILQILNRYARRYLHEKKIQIEEKKPKKIMEKKTSDLEFFLENCERLLRCPSPAAIIEIGHIFLEFGNDDRINKV